MEHTSLTAVSRNDLGSIGESFVVRLRQSEAKYRRGRAKDSNKRRSKGIGVNSHLKGSSDETCDQVKVFSCMVTEGLEEAVDFGPMTHCPLPLDWKHPGILPPIREHLAT